MGLPGTDCLSHESHYAGLVTVMRLITYLYSVCNPTSNLQATTQTATNGRRRQLNDF